MHRKNRNPNFDSLETRTVMSHMFHHHMHHAALMVHHPVVHHAPVVHHPAIHHHAALAHAPVIHAAIAKPQQTTTGFGGGNVDTTIPFVFGTDVGAAQNVVNFTSNTFQGVLFGFEWNGIWQITSRFNQTGDVNRLNSDITTLSQRMPFGMVDLLPTWQADLQSLQAGTPPASDTPISINFGSGNGDVANILYNDLITYLANGIGTNFNVMLSQFSWETDNLLTYNSTVQNMGSSFFPPPPV